LSIATFPVNNIADYTSPSQVDNKLRIFDEASQLHHLRQHAVHDQEDTMVTQYQNGQPTCHYSSDFPDVISAGFSCQYRF